MDLRCLCIRNSKTSPSTSRDLIRIDPSAGRLSRIHLRIIAVTSSSVASLSGFWHMSFLWALKVCSIFLTLLFLCCFLNCCHESLVLLLIYVFCICLFHSTIVCHLCYVFLVSDLINVISEFCICLLPDQQYFIH